MLVNMDGRPLVSQKRTIQVTNPHLVRFVAQAEVPFRHLKLTVVCEDCGGTPYMANGPADANFKMECACSIRTLANPDYARAEGSA